MPRTMFSVPLHVEEVRVCLQQIREQQNRLAVRLDLSLEERLEEFNRITEALIELHGEWKETLRDLAANRDQPTEGFF